MPASGAAPMNHTASVTGADWYAIDSGLFVTSSKDGSVRLWDPNTVKTVTRIDMSTPVAAVAAGHAQGLPEKVAVGCEDGTVRLVDMVSGAATQTLAGAAATSSSSSARVTPCFVARNKPEAKKHPPVPGVQAGVLS